MKRKLNSIRACRALRKENRELRNRLSHAYRVVESHWLEDFDIPLPAKPYLKAASRLDFTVQVEICNDQMRFTAVKRVTA
jgi:hypothetical protein